MNKKGFILITAFVLIFAFVFLGVTLLSFSIFSGRKTSSYIEETQNLYNQDSLASQQISLKKDKK